MLIQCLKVVFHVSAAVPTYQSFSFRKADASLSYMRSCVSKLTVASALTRVALSHFGLAQGCLLSTCRQTCPAENY